MGAVSAGDVLAVAVLAGAALVARLRPAWIVPALVVVLPLRLTVGLGAELPTLVVIGAALARSPEIARALRRRPVLAASLLVFPMWMLVSGAWARQAWFSAREAGKWFAIALAAGLGLVDPHDDPRPILWAACAALVPSALWALGERIRLIAPIGDPEELRLRLIEVGGWVRGRALYYHPNRLAEFVEQLGFLLVAGAVFGPSRLLCAGGALVALAGVWASGSSASLAVMAGGGLVVAVALAAWQANAGDRLAGRTLPRRRLLLVLGGLLLASAFAVGLAVIAYQVHGGLGPRALVYRDAWRVIRREPILGVGGGNWGFEAAPDPLRRFWFSGHTHSLTLQIWVETGIVGVLLAAPFFFVPIALGLVAAAEGPRRLRGLAAGASLGVLALLTHDLVHFFLREAADGLLTGVLLGIAAADRGRGDGAPGA